MARRSTIDLGHDAFLDIVANLVGILIILLAVVGSQSSQAIRQAAEAIAPATVDDEQAEAAWKAAAESATRSAAAQSDSDRLEAMVARYDQSIDQKRQSRDRLLDLLAVAREAWADSQSSLDADAVKKAKQSVALEQAVSELDTLDAQIEQLSNNDPPPPIAVEHLPTPMARAVFNDEIHLRIKNNLVSVVPLQKLLDEIKDQVQRGASSVRDGRTTDSAGPYNGYIARYVLDRQTGVVSRGGRSSRAVQIEMAGMIITPLNESIGQPASDVTRSRSALDIELAGRDPNRTTITAWVYPDSFESFAVIKRYLYGKGFATAARPMKFGTPIGASPRGSRSQSQ